MSMEQSLVGLASELTGLQAAQKVIQDRMDYIQEMLAGQRVPLHARTLTPAAPVSAPPVKNAPAKKAAPPSKAKLQALAKARAALAQRRKQAAGGNGKAKKVGVKRGKKAGAKKAPATMPGTAAAKS